MPLLVAISKRIISKLRKMFSRSKTSIKPPGYYHPEQISAYERVFGTQELADIILSLLWESLLQHESKKPVVVPIRWQDIKLYSIGYAHANIARCLRVSRTMQTAVYQSTPLLLAMGHRSDPQEGSFQQARRVELTNLLLAMQVTESVSGLQCLLNIDRNHIVLLRTHVQRIICRQNVAYTACNHQNRTVQTQVPHDHTHA